MSPARRADDQQVGAEGFCHLVQSAPDAWRSMQPESRVHSRLIASGLEQLGGVLSQDGLKSSARTSPRDRLAYVHVPENQLGVIRAESLGEGNGVAPAILSIDANDHLLEHIGPSFGYNATV
jgi:hypothetical protein